MKFIQMASYSGEDFLCWDNDIEDSLGAECETGSSIVTQYVYVCPECSKEYKSISGFRSHVMKKHDKVLRGW